MSKITIFIIFLLSMLFGVNCSAAFAQNCGLSGTAAWNPELHNIIADCPDKFASPDGSLILRVASDGTLSLWPASLREKIQWSGLKLEPPAMVSWSPSSDVFFLNDGEGSGLSSAFRLFRIRGGAAFEDKSFEQAAVSLYRRRMHCSPSAADPNVWGFAWEAQGSKIVLLVQSTVNEPCGRPGDFISLVLHTSDGHILKTLSKEQTRVRFGLKLPSSLFSK